MSDDRYEEVFVYDDDGAVVESYVERVVETGPDQEEPPDGYYDEHAEETGEVPPGWGDQGVTVLPVGVYDSRGYSQEPPF